MRKVEFKFDIDQWVETPFGKGIVSMLAVDDQGFVAYWVKTEHKSEWYKEHQLSYVDDASPGPPDERGPHA